MCSCTVVSAFPPARPPLPRLAGGRPSVSVPLFPQRLSVVALFVASYLPLPLSLPSLPLDLSLRGPPCLRLRWSPSEGRFVFSGACSPSESCRFDEQARCTGGSLPPHPRDSFVHRLLSLPSPNPLYSLAARLISHCRRTTPPPQRLPNLCTWSMWHGVQPLRVSFVWELVLSVHTLVHGGVRSFPMGAAPYASSTVLCISTSARVSRASFVRLPCSVVVVPYMSCPVHVASCPVQPVHVLALRPSITPLAGRPAGNTRRMRIAHRLSCRFICRKAAPTLSSVCAVCCRRLETMCRVVHVSVCLCVPMSASRSVRLL